jgi:hypothetical protein
MRCGEKLNILLCDTNLNVKPLRFTTAMDSIVEDCTGVCYRGMQALRGGENPTPLNEF